MILFDFLGKSHEMAEKKDLDGIRIGGRNRLRESSFCFDSAPSTRNWDVMNPNSVNFREFTKSGLHYKTLVSNGAQNSSSGIRFTIEDLGFEVGDDIAISCELKGSFGSTNSGFSIMHATPQSANFYAKIYYGAPAPEDALARIQALEAALGGG